MLKGLYGVTHVFHVPAVLRRSFVEMERRTDHQAPCMCMARKSARLHGGWLRAPRHGQTRRLAWRRWIGALNLAAGLRDAWLAHSPVIANDGWAGSAHQVSAKVLPGNRRHAGHSSR